MTTPISLPLQPTIPSAVNLPPSLPMSLVSGSFSPPNPAPSAPNSLASTVSTTKILHLSNFNPELKTRDIQSIFSEWEDEKGGFKIKWVDDTSCLIVFNDPLTAKKAFLSLLASPPPILSLDHGAKLRAYSGPDVTHILTSVQNRPRSRSNAGQTQMHNRKGSMSGRRGSQDQQGGAASRQQFRSGSGSGSGMGLMGGKNSPPPPVPELPGAEGSDKTLNGEGVATRAQVGDAGKRFINHSLGRSLNTNTSGNGNANGKGSPGVNEVSASLKGMTIQEANE